MNIKEEMMLIKKRNSVLQELEMLGIEKGLIKVESDVLEKYQTYLTENPIQKTKTMVKVQDLRGDVFVLKPDITTNIIKQVIPRLEPDENLDCYYLDKIFYINEEGFITTKRQFGVELIGAKKEQSDIALIAFVKDIFKKYNIDLILEVGNQKIVTILVELLDVDEESTKRIKKLIYQKNINDLTVLLNTISSNNPYNELITAMFDTENKLEDIKDYILIKNLSNALVQEIDKMIAFQEACNDASIFFDLSLMQEFDYYNGIIFRGYIKNYKTDIIRGGRYDLLTKEYGNMTEALGFSLDVDVLIKEVINNE